MKLPKGKKLIKPVVAFCLSIAILLIFKYIYNSKFVYEIASLDLPRVPKLIENYMTVQIPTIDKGPCTSADFQWFDYYSTELKTRVRLKRTGLCTLHYDSLANHSVRMKYENEDLRLKTVASELHMDVSPFGLYNNMFSEYSVYHILKPYTKHIPDAKLVRINSDESDIRILWEDEFDNSVREEEKIDWKGIAKVYKFSKDKFDDYFWVNWKTKNERIENLDIKFSNLLKPILEYVDKSLDKKVHTDFDEEEYLRYLALATVIGSTHLADNNVLIVADEDKKGDIIWSPVIYDPGGLYLVDDPIFSVFRFNFISEFFMRNPANVHDYLKYLYEYNEDIMGKNKVSKFYERFECNQVKRIDNFGEILLKANHRQYPTNDINGFCNAIDDFKQYDTKVYQRMNTRIKASSLRWNFYNKNGERGPLLVVWSHTAVPSKLTRIKCGNVTCTDSFELINKPWWDLPEDIIAPNYVRSNGTIAGHKAINTPYYYMYRWKEEGAVPTDTISLESENAITEVSQESVKALYPVIDVKSQLLEDPKDHYLFEIEIMGPVDSEYAFTPETRDLWSINLLSSGCRVVKSEGARFVFDCSDVNLELWPYPFDYTISLYYKNAKIRDEYGEMFIDVEIPQSHPYLNMDNMGNFLSGELDVSSYIDPEEGQNTYIIPADSSFEVNSDLDLGNATLVIENGVSLEMWPMTKITAANIIILGNLDSSPITFSAKEGLPGWSGIEVGDNAYIMGTVFKDVVNTTNGVLYGDGVSSLEIINSKFENNKTNITCSNCSVDISNVDITDGVWGLKASNSVVEVSGFSCTNTTFCFEVEDNLQKVSNLLLEDLRAWGFNVVGSSTDLTINNIISATKVPAVIAYRGYPKITKNFSDEAFKRVGVVEMRTDDPSMYERLLNADLEDLKKEYVNVIEQDKNNPQKFFLKKNEVQLDKDLVMPKGTELVINAGTKVNLGNDVSVLSYGKVSVLGTPSDKVLFRSSSKKNNSWGILAIKGPDSEAYIENAVFDNGGEDYLVSFYYTGAVTADHARSLVLKNSEFKNNTGDDAVNCKFTQCFIENNVFTNNSFDGVDFDFAVEGSKIMGNKFHSNGNDGIDVSSDSTLIYNNEVIRSGDKCISVGEGSSSSIFNNNFQGCKIGVEVKDGSEVDIFNNNFNNNSIAINAYLKKRRFFNGGKVNSYNNVFENNSEQAVKDDYSEISIEEDLPLGLSDKFREYLQ